LAAICRYILYDTERLFLMKVQTCTSFNPGRISMLMSVTTVVSMEANKRMLLHLSGPSSVVVIATGYGLDGPGIESWRGREFPPLQTGPGTHPASCTMGTGSFPRVNSGRGVKLNPHHLLVPCSRKSGAIPLLPLWAVRPVHSLSACTSIHITSFYYTCNVNTDNLHCYSLPPCLVTTAVHYSSHS